MANKDILTKVNDNIKSQLIRLIGSNGEKLGIISKRDALYQARNLGFDLVEVSSNVSPPVCKMMDYGKFKYKQKRKAVKTKKKQSLVNLKEVKFRPKTDIHDFHVKIKNIKKFLYNNNRVKISVVFRGREIVHVNIGREMISKILEELKNYILNETSSKLEGKQLNIVLFPNKTKS